MKYIYSLFIIILFMSCRSTEPGTVKQGDIKLGENGKVIDGDIKVLCTQPQKSYENSLIVELNARMDSLANKPDAELKASVKRQVVKLAEYTSRGLDRDLLLFRICQMANNRALSEYQIQSLIDLAMETYDTTVKKKNP